MEGSCHRFVLSVGEKKPVGQKNLQVSCDMSDSCVVFCLKGIMK